MVHVMAGGHLRRATVTASVMRNDAIAVGNEEQHLHVPVVRATPGTVVKHDGLSVLRTPVLVENFCIVFRCDCRHWNRLRLCQSASVSLQLISKLLPPATYCLLTTQFRRSIFLVL
jgi:hypothetical protein